MNIATVTTFVGGAAVGAAAILLAFKTEKALTQPSHQPPSDHAHAAKTTIESAVDYCGAPPPPKSHPYIRDMTRDMDKMMTDMHAPGYTGNWDVDFLAMMIPHHQGAIDMAKLVLIHGKDPLTRNLADEIIASQQVEIDAMTARLALLRGGTAGPNLSDFPSLSGTRGTAR